MEARFVPEETTLSLDAAPPPPKPDAFKIVTLRDLGSSLPCGIPVEGKRSKLFRLRPFRLKEEKTIGAIRDNTKNKAMTFGEFVSEVMAIMIQTVGPHSFDSMKHDARRLVLSQMLMADVLYMYLYLRYQAMGPEVPVSMQTMCPNCKVQIDFDADLGSLEVRTLPESIIDLRRGYELRDGIVIRGGERKKLSLSPLTWGAIERKEFATANKGEKEAMTIMNSIVAAEGVDLNPFAITEPEMDELTKYDMEGLVRDIEDKSPGPLMVVSIGCSACKLSYSQMIDWAYDRFFSRSSPPTNGKR